MESCACQLNFDTKMSGLPYLPKEQGILLTVRKNPGLQPDTASYLNTMMTLGENREMQFSSSGTSDSLIVNHHFQV